MKIEYYDLKLEAIKDRLPDVIGRRREMERLTRVISRSIYNNCFVIGPAGIGKTTLVHGWVKRLSKLSKYDKIKFIQLEAESFLALGSQNKTLFNKYTEALGKLPPCVLFIDDFNILLDQNLLFQEVTQLLKPILNNPKIRLILSCHEKEYKKLEEENIAWLNFFEIIYLKNQPFKELVQILSSKKNIISQYNISVSKEILGLIVKRAERFSILGQMPTSAIKLLDESLAQAKLEGERELKELQVERVVSDKTGIPLSQLQASEITLLKALEDDLNKRIIGQRPAIKKLVSIIQRAKLGLRNISRPLGSFLVLGPSGVGKTETAKLLAERVYGQKESFTRIDMSEFSQEHTVQALIGAPPSYIGYDAGGTLTNSVKEEPYSLILLDEIEKAHPKIFDIFLQVLDDGRLTSGQGETVDFTQTIIMATSNLAISEIVSGFKNGEDIHSREFIKTKILPVLTKVFRLEFINRFDDIIIFNPLTQKDLLAIAQLEIKKIEERVAKHNVRFSINPDILSKKIEELTDFRFGARPVKKFIEETCETLITNSLLRKHYKPSLKIKKNF